VFARPDGAPLHPQAVSDRFDKLVEGSGLPRIRLHDLRHTHASLALKAGVPVKVVSERLGHASTSFTLDVYSHVLPGMQEDAAETVAALFLPKSSVSEP
jgi:integrase